MHEPIHALVVGGQGTYEDGAYYTEHPDRDLSIAHAGTVRDRCLEFGFTHVVCAGGFTQGATPGLSEAKSFEAMWEVTKTPPKVKVSFDDVSLDSAENVIFGLMRLRLDCGPVEPIHRVGYYSQWQFKKRRMTGLAQVLGIAEKFYFYAFADFALANAGRTASEGEENQLRRMRETNDFLLLGKEWERKRFSRYQKSRSLYAGRYKTLQRKFPETFKALKELREITSQPGFDDPGPAFDHPAFLKLLKHAVKSPPKNKSAVSTILGLVADVRILAEGNLRKAFKAEVLGGGSFVDGTRPGLVSVVG